MSPETYLPFYRTLKAVACGRGDVEAALHYAMASNMRSKATVVEILKGAVLVVPHPGAPLPADVAFVEDLRSPTLLSRVRGFRQRPIYSATVRNTSGVTARWIGDGEPKPTANLVMSPYQPLEPHKLAAFTAFSDEAVRDLSLNADLQFRDEFVSAFGVAEDEALTDPSNAGSAAKPPAITHGAPTVAATGDRNADLQAMADLYTGSLTRAVWFLNSRDAMRMAGLKDVAGALEFPGIGPAGGDLLTLPAYTSDGVPPGVIVLCDPTQVAYQLGDATTTYSRNAVVQLNDTPDNPPTAATPLTSLFQINAHAFMVEQLCTWDTPRPGSVVVLTGAFAS